MQYREIAESVLVQVDDDEFKIFIECSVELEELYNGYNLHE